MDNSDTQPLTLSPASASASPGRSPGNHSGSSPITRDASKFMTLGRNQHRYGRLSILFDLDRRSRTLFVSVLAGRELMHAIAASTELAYHVRVFLLPNQDLAAVEHILFKNRSVRRNSAYKKYSTVHTTTQTPIVDEEFQFALSPLLAAPQDFSVYIAVMAHQPIANDPTGFIGCMSFPLLELLYSYQELPRWFWLLPKRQGLTHFESVQHKTVESPSIDDSKSDVVIYGRSAALPNSFINGVYTHQPERLDGRGVYRMRKRNLVLYFHGPRGAWAISDQLGSSAPFAFCDDNVADPYDISKPWAVFNKTREYRNNGAPFSSGPGGYFEIDPNVRCAVASPGAELMGPAFFEPRVPLPLRPLSAATNNRRGQAQNGHHSPAPGRSPVMNRRYDATASSNTHLAPPASFMDANGEALGHPNHHQRAASPSPRSGRRAASPQPRQHRDDEENNAHSHERVQSRKEAFAKILTCHQETLRAVEVVHVCANAIQVMNINPDIGPATVLTIVEDCNQLHAACQEMQQLLADMERRDHAHTGNVGAGLRHGASLLEPPMVTLFQRTVKGLASLHRKSADLDDVMTKVLTSKHLGSSNLDTALQALHKQVGQYRRVTQHMIDVTPENYPDREALQDAHKIFTTMWQKCEVPEPVRKVRAPSTLEDNNLALEAMEGRDRLGNLQEDSRSMSAYDAASLNASRRMSLAPDVEEDEDQLPQAQAGVSPESRAAAAAAARLNAARTQQETDANTAANASITLPPPPPPNFANDSATPAPPPPPPPPPLTMMPPSSPQLPHHPQAKNPPPPVSPKQGRRQLETPADHSPKPQQRSITPPAPSPAGEHSWMHGDLTKQDAEDLLVRAGGPLNGRFLVRLRAGKTDDLVLTLTYKQQPTHHLIGVDDQGFYTVNRKRYAEARALKDLLRELVKPGVPGWPQPLTDFTPRADATPAQIAADKAFLGLS